MNPTEWATLLVPFAGLLPGGYFLYLHATKDSMWARKKLHSYSNNEYIETEAGAMAIDDDNWTIYLYRE